FKHSGQTWSGVPIIAANMDTVGTFEMAQALAGFDILTAVHKHDAKLNQLMAWLEDHFAEEVCWEAVAEQFSLSLRTLHRQLKQHTG
ncbi:hypothetical protein MJM83_28505, partial [Salmonella enterica subsp. enterica serovar Montevideo]|nr:hypothetical protein [Salmonella enterica subsp. enterica serovar Montevideo]